MTSPRNVALSLVLLVVSLSAWEAVVRVAQIQAFIAFSAAWKADRGAPWAVPTLKEVGRIAWRHLLEDADKTAASTHNP
jgi:hypothetical protein